MNIEKIVDMYYKDNLSTYVIAEKLGTYPNKIRRLLTKHGYALKDKSEAQKAALASNRAQHPTEGKAREPEIKVRISESVYQYWQNLSEKERDKRVKIAQEQWYNMSEEEKEALRKSAAEAVRRASKEGSKMERFLLEALTDCGYSVLFHWSGVVPRTDLEVDLFVPSLKTVIEVDGPAHFFPIWGPENLQRHVKADAHKSGLLLNAGMVVIRIKHLTKSLSEKNKRDAIETILEELEKIKKKFPVKSKRYIELEIN